MHSITKNTTLFLLGIGTLTALLWASAFVGIRYCLHTYHPGSLALLRYLIASVCMGIVYYFIPHKTPLRKRDIPTIILCGLLGIGFYNISLNYAELSIPAAIASFTISQAPVLSTILAIIFLGERPKFLVFVGIGISFFGVLLIALSQQQTATTTLTSHGLMMLIITLFCSSLYAVIQKPLFKHLNPIQFVCYAIWAGTALLCIYLPQLQQDLKTAPLSSLYCIIYLGIFPATIAYLLWSYLLAQASVSKVTSIFYAIPIITMGLGWLFLNEIPKTFALIGGLIALAGAYLVNRR